MKKVKKHDEVRPEYGREKLGKGVRGKYYSAYNEAHNIVLLNPEVAKAFPSEEAVNAALMSLIKGGEGAIGATKGSSSPS